ncbi:MAG: TIGR01777 family oxidoreductase [Verrucomicrobiales bacterium]|nr:TIGR01777 family oxidoreductase [Verrucomicrobiales bacterium]
MSTKREQRVVIAGGAGFLGRALAAALDKKGYDVVVLTRDPASYAGAGRAIRWDGETVDETWVAELEGAKALVNLAGKGVNCRQTKASREEILKSRVTPTETLGEGLRLVYRVPEVWVQAGSLAIYGNAGDRICDESGFVPDEYPTDVCVAWEEALGRAIRPEMRWSMLRIGFVLGRDGGALPALARLARLGLGGTIGSGRQWISWIHLDDMMRLFIEAIENPAVHGIYNASGLQPVPNAEFMATLRESLRIGFGLPAPAALVKIGAPLMGADPDLALNGRRGLPVKIHGLGFRFQFHELEDALADLLRPKAKAPAPAAERDFVQTLAR